MTYRNRPAILALACLGAVLMIGCTPNPGASHPSSTPQTMAAPTTPAASTTATPATTPPAGPPERPPAAEGLTLAAAEAFIRHYIDLMNYASQTGDTSALTAASEGGCRRCQQYADFVKKVNEANGGLSGDYRERVKEVSELVRGGSGRLGGSAIVTIGAYTTKASPSAKPVTSKAKTYTEQVALSPAGGNWIMYEMKLEQR